VLEDTLESIKDDQKCLENIQKEKFRLKIVLGQPCTDPVLVHVKV
jgi:hypothetical protein